MHSWCFYRVNCNIYYNIYLLHLFHLSGSTVYFSLTQMIFLSDFLIFLILSLSTCQQLKPSSLPLPSPLLFIPLTHSISAVISSSSCIMTIIPKMLPLSCMSTTEPTGPYIPTNNKHNLFRQILHSVQITDYQQ